MIRPQPDLPAEPKSEMARAVTNLRFWVTIPAWASLMAALALSLVLPPALLQRISIWPFLVSLLFLGLPHGAWDHRVMPAAQGRRIRLSFVAAFCGVYLTLVLIYGMLWPVAAVVAFLLFIGMSWLHWGQGDAAYLRIWGKEGSENQSGRFLIWLARGGAPIALPIFAHPQGFARVASGVTDRFREGGALGPEPWRLVLSPPVCAAGLILLGGIIVACLIRSFRYNGGWKSPAFREDAGELALLYTVFAGADTVFAVGIYFCLWHGLRHIARLLLLDDNLRGLCAQGSVSAAFLQFGRQILPIMGASFALLGAVYLYWARSVHSAEGFIYLYLALIAALTFPHFLLVLWLDARRPCG